MDRGKQRGREIEAIRAGTGSHGGRGLVATLALKNSRANHPEVSMLFSNLFFFPFFSELFSNAFLCEILGV